MAKTGRNDPCPCGSGRKYKDCCLGRSVGKPGAPVDKSTKLIFAGMAGVLVVAALLLARNAREDGQTTSAAAMQAPAPAAVSSIPAPTPTPLPWEYDEVNDQHWHAGHGHWHDGPPPEGVTARATADAATTANETLVPTTPEPWQYDGANDQHWHAGHGHWHPGPPPPESERTP